METIRVAQGDNYQHEMILKYENNTLVDLTAATAVVMSMLNEDTRVIDWEVTCTIVDAATSKIRFTLDSSTTATKAMYTVLFKVMLVSSVISVPNMEEQGLWVY